MHTIHYCVQLEDICHITIMFDQHIDGAILDIHYYCVKNTPVFNSYINTTS